MLLVLVLIIMIREITDSTRLLLQQFPQLVGEVGSEFYQFKSRVNFA